MDVSSAVQTQTASAELQEAAAVVCEHVNRLADRVNGSLAKDDRHVHACCAHFKWAVYMLRYVCKSITPVSMSLSASTSVLLSHMILHKSDVACRCLTGINANLFPL